MKKFIFMLLATGIITSTARAQSLTSLFTVISSLANPISTFDNCNRYSFYGSRAYNLALEGSTLECRKAGYVDCVELGGEVYLTVSNEFPGYAVCHAKVTVRGWR